MRHLRAGDQCLGRHAAGVDAGTPEQVPLNQRHGHARRCQSTGKRGPGLAGADDDGVERQAHDSSAMAAMAMPGETSDSNVATTMIMNCFLRWMAMVRSSSPNLVGTTSSRCCNRDRKTVLPYDEGLTGDDANRSNAHAQTPS
jgi:hypothetical protein